MLKKLLKYETRATARWYAPIYIGIVVLSIINKLFMMLSESSAFTNFLDSNELLNNLFKLATGFLMAGYVMAIIGAFVLTFALTIYRFYKNLLGDEGYLMFTLPVNPAAHIWSKLIVSVMWIVASALVALLSLFIIVFNGSITGFIGEFFNAVAQALGTPYGAHVIIIGIEIIAAMLTGIVCFVLMMYASMSVGHLKQNHRILYSVAAYIVFNIIMQIITVAIMFIGMTVLSSNGVTSLLGDETNSLWVLHIIFIGLTVMEAAISAVYFLITNYILKKKLNLE